MDAVVERRDAVLPVVPARRRRARDQHLGSRRRAVAHLVADAHTRSGTVMDGRDVDGQTVRCRGVARERAGDHTDARRTGEQGEDLALVVRGQARAAVGRGACERGRGHDVREPVLGARSDERTMRVLS
jgi:hypothetical protein